MKTRVKRVLASITAAVFLTSVVVPPSVALAEPSSASMRSDESMIENVKYLEADGTEQTVDQAVVLTDSTTNLTQDNGADGWYVVNDVIDTNNFYNVTGDVKLILADNAHLTTHSGISLLWSGGQTLTIYSQSTGSSQGELTALNTTDGSALECGEGNTLVINGGTINATSGSEEKPSKAAAIGGNKGDNSGTITINGGNVTATTYAADGVAGGGAAIGGGGSEGGSDTGHDSGQITINGGNVTATAYSGGAGIGGGSGSGSTTGGNGQVAITGGHVIATSTNGGAGIGGGSGSNSAIGGSATVDISGSTVEAKSDGSSASGLSERYYGAGIGSGSSGTSSNIANDISISGGKVTAYTASSGSYGSAAIGGGKNSSSGTIAISGGTLLIDDTASNSYGIGAGSASPEKNQNDQVTITGGTISTINGEKAVVDEPTNGSVPVYYTVADVQNIYGNNAAVNNATLTGYGFNGVETDDSGMLHLYLPEGSAEAQFGDVPYNGTITSNETTNKLEPQGMYVNVQEISQGADNVTLRVTAPQGSTVYYIASDSPITDPQQIIENGASIEVGSDAATVTLNDLQPGQTKTYYFVATKNDETSDIQSIEVTPQAISLEDAQVSLSQDSFVYNGSAQIPDITVELGDTALVKDTDYTVRFDGNTTNVGTVTVIVEGIGKYTGTVDSKTYTITPRSVMASLSGSTTKTYDGTTDVTDTKNLELTLDDVVQGEAVSAEAESYSYASSDVGTGIEITANNVSLAGDEALLTNYTLSSTTVSATIGEITQAQGEIDAASYNPSREYTGEPLSLPTANELNITGGTYDDLTFTWYDAENNELDTAPTDAGTYSLRISLPESTNYTAAETTVSVTIGRASYRNTITGTVYPGVQDEVTLPDDLPEGLAYDSVHLMSGSDEPIEIIGIEDNVFTFKGKDGVKDGEPYLCGISLKEVGAGNKNYDLNTSQLIVALTGKEAQSVTVDMSGITLGNKTFDGKPLTYSGAAKVDGQDLNFTYQWLNSDGELLTSAPKDAGTYVLRATVDSPYFTGQGEKSVEIAPKELKVTADNKTATVGDAMPELTYQVSGLVGEDKLTTEPTLTCDADMNKNGDYPIVLSGADAGSNYTISYVNGTLTVKEKSSGGGGGGTTTRPNHDITIPDDITGGDVTATDDQAKKGEKVTITVTPEEGNRVDSIIVTDENGKELDVTDNGDGTYSFIMPNSDVEIEVTFVKDDSSAELPFTDVPKDAWYADVVDYVYNKGLMTGVSDTLFAPETSSSRAMIVSILHRLEGNPDVEVSQDRHFTDVTADAWYAEPVYWAYTNGIVGGISDTLFAPDQTITREQFAVMLHNYAIYKGLDTTATSDLSSYSDADKISPYAKEAMEWANAKGLINGMTDDTLVPQGLTTRAQTAAILARFCETVTK